MAIGNASFNVDTRIKDGWVAYLQAVVTQLAVPLPTLVVKKFRDRSTPVTRPVIIVNVVTDQAVRNSAEYHGLVQIMCETESKDDKDMALVELMVGAVRDALHIDTDVSDPNHFDLDRAGLPAALNAVTDGFVYHRNQGTLERDAFPDHDGRKNSIVINLDCQGFAGYEGWNPALLSTLSGWYDSSIAATITATAGAVSLHVDKSGNGRDLVQATAADQPTTGVNAIGGLNVIRYQSDMMKTDFADWATSDFALFVLYQVPGDPGEFGDGLLSMEPQVPTVDLAERGRVTSANADEWRLGFGGFGAAQGVNMFALPDQSLPELFSIRNEAGVVRNAYRNAIEVQSVASTVAGAWADKELIVGDFDGDRLADVNFAELLIVEDVTLETRQLIEGYLAWKWGQESILPVGHPYENEAP